MTSSSCDRWGPGCNRSCSSDWHRTAPSRNGVSRSYTTSLIRSAKFSPTNISSWQFWNLFTGHPREETWTQAAQECNCWTIRRRWVHFKYWKCFVNVIRRSRELCKRLKLHYSKWWPQKKPSLNDVIRCLRQKLLRVFPICKSCLRKSWYSCGLWKETRMNEWMNEWKKPLSNRLPYIGSYFRVMRAFARIEAAGFAQKINKPQSRPIIHS